MSIAKATHIRLDLTSDLQRWRAFLAIAEIGSLTRAALYLDTNPTMLSRKLNALERECGTRLFNRTGRGVELSAVGARILSQVKALLASAEQLEGDIRGEAQDPTGHVSVGLLPSISVPLVVRLVSHLRSRLPGVHLKLLEGSSGQVEEWLVDGRVDIGILYRYGQSLPEFEQALATVDSYLIGARGNRLARAGEVPFKALDGLPMILPGAPNGLRTALDAIARQERITIAPLVEADSLQIMKSVVMQAQMFTVFPMHIVWQEVADGRLEASRLVSPTLQRTISMALARHKGPSRAVAAVVAQIVEIVEDLAANGLWRVSA
ncbi:MAG: LysR family transcriptional regulator [Lautropia sp.]